MKKFHTVLLAAVLTVSLAACGNSSATQNSTSSAQSEDTEEEVEETSGGRYAIIMKALSNSFWQEMYTAVEEYAADNNISLDLYTTSSDTDDEGQLVLVEQCISSGDYDVIGIAPTNSATLVPAVKSANDAGIPVVNIDELFSKEEMEAHEAVSIAGVSSDNISIGYMGAEYLCSLIEEGSQVAIVEGVAINVSSLDRTDGARMAFEEAGMEIVADEACDWSADEAMEFIAEAVETYPDIKAIYVCNDVMASGVRQALANASRTDILVCGTDGDADAIRAVAGEAEDGIGMTATIAQDPASIGITSLEIMMDAYADPDSYPGSSYPDMTTVEAILITADNAADYISE